MASDEIAQSISLLDDVADLAKFDQGRVLHIHPQLVPLESFGKKILEEMPAARPGVETILELCPVNEALGTGPAMAMTDPQVLRRVLLHLLNNAIHVTEFGTVKFCIGYKNNRLTFSVSDTGPGLEMPDDAADGDLPVIFQRYHRELLPEESLDLTMTTNLRDKIEEGINTRKKTGLGIGLSLTYHLVQSLGGELRCTSKKGEGSKFQFSLARNATFNISIPTNNPLIPATIVKSKPSAVDALWKANMFGSAEKPVSMPSDDDTKSMSTMNSSLLGDITPTSEAKTVLSTDIPYSFEMPIDVVPQVLPSSLATQGFRCEDPPSILVVEDTTTCAKMLCRLLSQIKCATKWAENGKVAVDILREATPGTYDLILMDLRMPVMDGFEATRIIKHELGLTIPVVALTGDDNDDNREVAVGIGFDAFHGKPMKRSDIMAVVKEFTGYEVL